MPSKIASTASISSTAIIGENVEIGEHTVISDYVVIRDNVKIGDHCKVYPHAVIGEDPQDFSFNYESSFVEIGDHNIIREFVSIHRAVGEGAKTIIGNGNMIMAYSHIGHNCKLQNNIVLANGVQLAGHVFIEDNVNIGGLVAIHQHCRVGKFAMISGMAATNKDIPPFCMYAGTPALGISVYRVGLKRAACSQEAINQIFKAFKLIYKSDHSMLKIVEIMENEFDPCPEISELINFLKSSKKGIKKVSNHG